VGGVVTVVAPDAAQRGRAGGACLQQAAGELDVQRVPCVLGLLAGVGPLAWQPVGSPAYL